MIHHPTRQFVPRDNVRPASSQQKRKKKRERSDSKRLTCREKGSGEGLWEREREMMGPFFFTGFPPCIIGDDCYWSDRGREMLMPTMGGGKLAHHACPACGGDRRSGVIVGC